jgi:putative membrane protein
MKKILANKVIKFKQNWFLQLLIVIFTLFWIIMAISPTDRTQWYIENILSIATVLVLIFTYRKFRFTNLSYLLMFLLLCFHTFAAHYTYQNTPFDVWLKATFHTERSYFDRVVHCIFGLCFAYPFREVMTRLVKLRGLWSYVIPVAFILSSSAIFEIIEMGAAYIAGQVGQEYVGLQGDVFDSHKDMLLGWMGSMISMLVLFLFQKVRSR